MDEYRAENVPHSFRQLTISIKVNQSHNTPWRRRDGDNV
jgi:hypothetical protein